LRKEIVPIDLMSEQKNILGLMSTRQLIYITVGGILAYNIIYFLENHFAMDQLPITMRVGIHTFMISPIAVLVSWLGFLFRPKDDMFWDKYLLIKYLYKRQNKDHLIYHHGNNPPTWRS
jgi:hypothetical protein